MKVILDKYIPWTTDRIGSGNFEVESVINDRCIFQKGQESLEVGVQRHAFYRRPSFLNHHVEISITASSAPYRDHSRHGKPM